MHLVRALSGIAAVGSLIALVVLSWLPKDMEIRTGLAGQIEHFVAYAGTGLLAVSAWRWRPVPVAVALLALAAILEIGQLWVPGRTSQVIDFVASGAGALAGVGVTAWLLGRLR